MTIKPITKIRYTDLTIEREVKFQHIVIFAVSGILVILCSLFNYLTLFVSRFRMRHKELALRVVCGASDGSLLVMLSVEFILMLLFAVGLGAMFTKLVHQPFLELSEIQMDLPTIYFELLTYIGGIILISLFVFWLILFIFRHKSLNVSIRQSNKKLFRKVSVIVQLVISVGFAFCSIVIFKQIHFLHNSSEMGFSFKNSAAINRGFMRDQPSIYSGEVIANLLKQIPEITEVVYSEEMPMSPLIHSKRVSRNHRTMNSHIVNSWDDQPADVENMRMNKHYVTPEFIAFYDLQLLAGEMLTHADPETLVLLNESAVKAFGWHDPIGKHFVALHEGVHRAYTVKGVIKNIYNFEPTIEAEPYYYLNQLPVFRGTLGSTVLFRYRDGMWKTAKGKIEKLLKDNYSFGSIQPTYLMGTSKNYKFCRIIFCSHFL